MGAEKWIVPIITKTVELFGHSLLVTGVTRTEAPLRGTAVTQSLLPDYKQTSMGQITQF